jgi:hypothetical protein
MRWKQAQFSRVRIRSGFLFFPRCIGGERRWLERATWEQKYCPSYTGEYWEDTRWITIPEHVYGGRDSIVVSDSQPPPEWRIHLWFDTSTSEGKCWNGAEWVVIKK